MTQIVAVDPDHPDPSVLARAAAILRSGGLVAFGTETVYGLGADATNPAALARIFAAKDRPASNPLIVHVADKVEALRCVAAWPASAEVLADAFWPGPLTLVLPRSAIIPDLVTAGRGQVGVRVPASGVARRLIAAAGVPVAAPSANRSNRISPTLARHVARDLDGVVDLILDSGPCDVGIESTVLDLSGPDPMVLRPGRVSPAELGERLGVPVGRLAGSPGAPGRGASSPGQGPVHYAPSTPSVRIDRDELAKFRAAPGRRWGLLTLGERVRSLPQGRPASVVTLGGPDQAARGLYDALHRLDDLDLDLIVVALPPRPDDPGWLAVLDRIDRATRPWDRKG